MAFKIICNKNMKRKVGVSQHFFLMLIHVNTWIKPVNSENLAKIQKVEEQTSLFRF